MLANYLPKLRGLFTIILASSSPRRQSIFRDNLQLSVEVVLPLCEENSDKSSCSGPEDYVCRTSRMKCLDVVQQLQAREQAPLSKPLIVVSADTIVVHDGIILEKPKDARNAVETLQKLSGSSHHVLTAVTVAIKLLEQEDFRVQTFCEQTAVAFSELSQEVIEAYVDSGEPMDKAGSYGIQAQGSSFVRRIEGCYFNVVGFPINRFCEVLVALLRQLAV